MTFDNIPQNYQDLILVSNIKGITNSYPQINFNSEVLFSRIWITSDGNSFSSGRISDNYIVGGCFWNTNDFGFSTVTNILNYSNPSMFKTFITETGNPSVRVDVSVNTWRSINPVVSLQYIGSGGMAAGSTISLWGVR